MKKLLRALTAAFLLVSGSAYAQNIDTVPGASVSGITGGVPAFQQQNMKFDCSNVTPTSGTCIPLVEQSISGTVMSATNGLFSNVLQGNAVLSATNGLFSNLLQGNTALSATNGLFVAPTTAANWLVTGTGTAGSAASGVQTVQGIASMTPLLENPGTIATWGLMSGTVPGTAPTNTELVGCKYTSAGFTLTNLQGNPLSCAVDGSLAVTVNNTLTALVNNADGITPVSTVTGGAGNSPVNSYLFAYNGTSFDRLQVDASKFLKVNCATGCSASTSITSWGGGTLGAMANFGTTPTAVLVPGVNASLFVGTTAAVSGSGTATGALRVELANNGTGLVGLNAGTNLVGKVGIDQTTVGTTNGISLAQIGTVTVSSGTGAVGAGSQRVAVGTDTATVAGSTPAAAGFVATGSAPPTGSQYVSVLQGAATTGGKATGLISCDNHVFKHITTPTDTNAITGVASQVIYVCSWRSRAAGTATWFLEQSNNTAGTCGTPTQLNGVATEAVNTGETWGSNFWSGLKSSSANGICINSTGTGGVDVDVWYTQF